jgi:hypothetical protein
MSEDDNSGDKPTNGRRGRRPSKGRASSTVARPKAPQRPRVTRRTARKPAEEQVQPRETAERAGEAAAVKTARTAKAQASAEAKDTPQERGKAGGQRGGLRQRAGGRRTRVDTSGVAAPDAGPVKPTSAEPFYQPAVDPMADLTELAEQSLRESVQSLRSVSESRTLSELLERQSRHMRLMTEIWMRQAQRSMEVFNAMLSRRRK